MTSVSNYFHLFLFLNKNSHFFSFFGSFYIQIYSDWSETIGASLLDLDALALSIRPGPAGRAPLLIDNRRPLLEFVAVELFVSLHTHFIYSSVDCYEILVVVVELRKQKFDSN